MKRYLMYKFIMKYLTDKDLSLNAKGFLSMILFNDEINALELSKYCSDDLETIKDTMLELRIMKYVKYDPETNMLLAGPSRYDETSPHMHIVGVPIKDGYKNGLSMQVCKSKVFNKTSLMELQDQMRTLCIKDYNEEYNLNEKLKTKQKGRNQDINVRDMDNYAEAKAVLDLESDKLDKINEDSLHLDDLSKNMKNDLDGFNYNKLLRGYVISKEDKDKINKYIEEVNKQNEKYKDINNLKNILDIGYDSMKRLETIEDDNKALNIKVKALEKQSKEQKKKIIELDKLAEHFKESADKFMGLYYNIKDKFDKFIRFLAERLLNPKTKEKYKEFTGDLFGHGVLTYNDSNELEQAKEEIIKEQKEKEKEKPKKITIKEKDGYKL